MKEDEGRATNVSLFDEIRLSFCNIPRRKIKTDCDESQYLDGSFTTTGTQTEAEITKNQSQLDNIELNNNRILKNVCVKSVETQTSNIELYIDNNNVNCRECNDFNAINKYAAKLETDVKQSNRIMIELRSEIIRYEDNLNILQSLVDEGNVRNKYLQSVVNGLQSKIDILEESFLGQRKIIDKFTCETSSVLCQSESGNEFDFLLALCIVLLYFFNQT